jgi:hypothetical protein
LQAERRCYLWRISNPPRKKFDAGFPENFGIVK